MPTPIRKDRPALLASAAAVSIEPMGLPVKAASAVSGLSRSRLYVEAAAGNIVMRKCGRTTIVDMESVRRFLASLPVATIRAPRSNGPASPVTGLAA